ncbi:hypothetical protein [Hymenobacter saemangeumensis]|uniref:hypothetical protein n=1 Tax=Hymenobacter saemangeumensis TaxID=1084522 RepID=UPI0031E64719
MLYQDLTPTTADASALQRLKPSFITTLYRTEIEVVGKHLSGLLFFKSLPNNTFRVVFTNEMGLNLFDFEFSERDFKVIHCIEQLNKKPVINQLRKDIGFLLMTELDFGKGRELRKGEVSYFAFAAGKEFTYYITDTGVNQLYRIENTTAKRKKVVVSVTRLVQGMPDSVFVDHKLFDFTISLKQIIR